MTKEDNGLQTNNESKSVIRNIYSQINETLEAILLDGSMNTVMKVPVSEIVKKTFRFIWGKNIGSRWNSNSKID
jgi:hypothetical protein